jgi:hypothetical protein
MKKLVLLAILGSVVVASVWSARRTDSAAETDNQLLSDRIWIDHLPRNERDTIHAFIAVSEVSIGFFQATSQWRGTFEAFRYEANDNELRIVFPQTGDRETVRTKARRCTEQQMDFCLELDGASRGPKKYYSRKGWEIDHHQDLDAVKHRIDTLRDQLTAGH